MSFLITEHTWFSAGIIAYALAIFSVAFNSIRHHKTGNGFLRYLVAGVVAFTVAITLRWQQTGSGPFLTLYEVLLSNLFSLGLVIALIYYTVKGARISAMLTLPLLLFLGLWAMSIDATPVPLPATYNTWLLWLHVGVGKIFLGTCMVASGLAGVLLLQYITQSKKLGAIIQDDAVLDIMVWKLMAVAFVFHSMMLIAGAVWAQDAWGRFWAWDSLETWAFITWLVIGLSLHARFTFTWPSWSGWTMAIVIFMLAFLTFFGVPFSSIGPHKGII